LLLYASFVETAMSPLPSPFKSSASRVLTGEPTEYEAPLPKVPLPMFMSTLTDE
jgi:hypothetical protein